MSETRVFIVRHGETDFNKKGLLQGRGIDAPLNNRGRKQARSLAEYLVNYKADGLAASSLQRTWQTAEPFQRQTNLKLIKNKNLDEMDFGSFEGAAYKDVAEDLNDIQNAWQQGDVALRIPGGESPEEVFSRANESVRSLINSFNGHTLVCILHGRLIRILLSQWLGYGLQNMHKIQHQNCAVNHLTVRDNTFKSIYLNKISHL
ncbi:MAG: histidine phosphatase family protein [Balneolaceae bacterium]